MVVALYDPAIMRIHATGLYSVYYPDCRPVSIATKDFGTAHEFYSTPFYHFLFPDECSQILHYCFAPVMKSIAFVISSEAFSLYFEQFHYIFAIWLIISVS